MRIYTKLALSLLLTGMLGSCGSNSNQVICECTLRLPPSVQFSPVPAQATVTATKDGDPAGNVSASCNSDSDCQNVRLGVSAGTYTITVTAPGYNSASKSITFAFEGSCCPLLVPNTISITLTPN